MLTKKTVEDIQFDNKRVFVRCDFNVPLNDTLEITDDTRITASLPTIEYLLSNGGKLILASHLGRPKGKRVPGMSLKPVAERLSRLLDKKVVMAPDCVGPGVESLAMDMDKGDIILLENVRYHDGETSNDPGFAQSLAKLAEVFVNDAFGTAHRAHASNVGITKHIKDCVAGYLINKEIEYFDNTIADPERPFVAILGGAKISTKIPVIENLMAKVDTFLIGGGMAFTFLKAMGHEIGNSLVEDELVPKAKGFIELAREQNKQLLLPHDVVVADEFNNSANFKTVSAGNIGVSWMGLDIGQNTIAQWVDVIKSAKTVVWNGPMGAFEMPNFSTGTIAVGKAIAESDAISIVGGGDSVAALDTAGVRESISHVSTGGGASLDFLAGKKLPGIEALNDKE